MEGWAFPLTLVGQFVPCGALFPTPSGELA